MEATRIVRELSRLVEALVKMENPLPLPRDAHPLLRRILLEYMRVRSEPRVAFLGPPGSFSHEAVLALFEKPVEKPELSISSVVARLVEGSVDYAVVPIENSIEGPVGETLRALAENDVMVWLEYVHPIRLVLAAREDVARIRRVYGHPHALGEAREALDRLLPGVEKVPVASTSLAAQRASEDAEGACVCSRLAARLNRLRVVAEGLTRHPNFTRFLVLAPRDRPEVGVKTSIVAALEHKPGSLYRFLEPFAKRNVNLTMIYSYPAPGTPWRYYFFLDMEGSRLDENIHDALEEARGRAVWVKLLGSYPVIHG